MIAEVASIQEQLQQKWFVFWWALGISLLSISVALRQGFFKSFQVSSFPVIRGKDVLKGFGYFLFMQILFVPALIGLILILDGKDPNNMLHLHPQLKGWINLFVIFGGFGGALLAYLELTSYQRQQIWHQTTDPWYLHIRIGIIAWFIGYPLVLAFSEGLSLMIWHFFHHSIVEQIAVQNLRHTMTHPILFGLTAVTVVTLVPLTEEFLFRGLLQSWLKHKLRQPFLAVVITSLIFALFHYSSHQGVTNIELLSSLFLLSCMLGYIYERQRSLWAPIGLHSFFNFISLLFIFNDV